MDQTTYPALDLMSQEEREIVDFYRDGMSIAQIAEATGYSVYKLKKLLAYEPKLLPAGYIWRSLFGKHITSRPANE